MQKLLHLGAQADHACEKIDYKSRPNTTPIIEAIKARQYTTSQQKDSYIQIIQVLLECGAIPHKADESGRSPLYHAIERKDWIVSSMLLPLTPSYTLFVTSNAGRCAFEEALYCSNKELVLDIIRNFRIADINVTYDRAEKIDLEFPSWYPVNTLPIIFALDTNRLDAVKLLLEMGSKEVSPNNILATAIDNCSVQMTEFAIEKGADVNACVIDLSDSNPYGKPRLPMHIAFTKIADCFQFSEQENDLQDNAGRLENLLKVVNILKQDDAASDLVDLFDIVAMEKPSPEALLLLIHFDPRFLQAGDLKKDAVWKIYKYVLITK